MIIIYNPLAGSDAVDPIAIVDYTRSDEQYSEAQVARYALSLGKNLQVKGKRINVQNLKIFSLDYSLNFTHSGINYGDSLKTQFKAVVSNAPMELINLLNIKQYTSSENISALKSSLNAIVDPQVFFPTGAFVIKPNSSSNDTVIRSFMLYNTPFNFDARRINSTLVLQGSEFDSMVMRLKFAVDIEKEKPLLSQLSKIFAAQKIRVTENSPADVFAVQLSNFMPVVSRYYPPGTINAVMGEICRDNNLAFKMDFNSSTLTLQSLNPGDSPPQEKIRFCFNNYILASNLISTFSLQNYATCIFKAEAVDVQLFENVAVYDDSFNPGQFSNLRQLPGGVPVGRDLVKGYRFYILEYTYTDSRNETSVEIRGTNNWLISNFKLSSFLENKVYQGASL